MDPSRSVLIILTAATLASCPGVRELEPTPPERTDIAQIGRKVPPHEPLPGSQARTALLLTQAIPGLSAHVEVREYYVSQGRALTIVSPSEAVFEVRSGRFEISAPGVKGEHLAGISWSAVPGERVVVRTTSEMAILRAMYVVKD